MWTCDVIAAVAALEKEINGCTCLADIRQIEYTCIIEMTTTGGTTYYYHYTDKRLEKMA